MTQNKNKGRRSTWQRIHDVAIFAFHVLAFLLLLDFLVLLLLHGAVDLAPFRYTGF